MKTRTFESDSANAGQPISSANIQARQVALWVCSFIGLLFILALGISSLFGPVGTTLLPHGWKQFQEALGGFWSQMRNPIAVILLLALLTGVMRAPRKEFRIPATALSMVSLVALLLIFFGGVR